MTDEESAWRSWDGNGAPPAANTTVIVRFRDGLESKGRRAGLWRWIHLGVTDDIVAYKVVPPAFVKRMFSGTHGG